MLEIIIVFAIYAGLQKLFIDIPYSQKIKTAKNTTEAIKYRKQLKTARFALFSIFLIAYIAYLAYSLFLREENPSTETFINNTKFFVLGIIILYQFLFKGNREYDKYLGNISTYKKTDYLSKNPSFALFLRGFEDDNYSKETFNLSSSEETTVFSEYQFMSVLQTRIPSCAIGMTKESDSPVGANRVYVDDTNWKEDVKEMMEKSKEIYILINDRTSCIWEIEQTKNMLDKTMFIINNRQKYENVRISIIKEMELPIIPEHMEQYPHLVLRYENNNYIFEPFENTIDSYAKILRVSSVPSRRKNFNSHSDLKGCIIAIGVLALIALLVFGIRYLRPEQTDESLYEYHLRHEEEFEPSTPVTELPLSE